jgi:hypothetical protein
LPDRIKALQDTLEYLLGHDRQGQRPGGRGEGPRGDAEPQGLPGLRLSGVPAGLPAGPESDRVRGKKVGMGSNQMEALLCGVFVLLHLALSPGLGRVGFSPRVDPGSSERRG